MAELLRLEVCLSSSEDEPSALENCSFLLSDLEYCGHNYDFSAAPRFV